MSRRVLATALILFAFCSSALATVPDTIRLGDDVAYYMGDGVVRVPVFVFNDNGPFNGISVSFGFASTGNPIVPDSVTHAGRTAGTGVFDLFIGFSDYAAPWGGNPDSACAGLVALYGEVEIGSGVIADFWFSGSSPGDFLSFWGVDQVGPCGTGIGSYGDPDGGPIVPATNLVVSDAPLQITAADAYTVEATRLVTIPVQVYGINDPFTLEIHEFYGPNPQVPSPTISGDNPWTVLWQPAFQNVGLYTMVLKATDALDNEVLKTIEITVTETSGGDPCAVLRGDMDCDGQITITDLLFLVDFMFNSGPPSNCSQ